MRQTSPHFRPLVLALAMHLAHVPVPIWDGGDGLERCGRGAVALCCWDLDPLLLGIDPPENLDEGPVDSDPETPQAEFVSADRVASRPSWLLRGDVQPSEALTAGPAPLVEDIASAAGFSADRSTCYSASYAGSHPWRTLLRVMTV